MIIRDEAVPTISPRSHTADGSPSRSPMVDDMNTEAAQHNRVAATADCRSYRDKRDDALRPPCLDTPWPPKSRQRLREIAMEKERRFEQDGEEKEQQLRRQEELLSGLNMQSSRACLHPMSPKASLQLSPRINGIAQALLSSPSGNSLSSPPSARKDKAHKLSKDRLKLFGGGDALNNQRTTLLGPPLLSPNTVRASTPRDKQSKSSSGLQNRHKAREAGIRTSRDPPQQPKRSRDAQRSPVRRNRGDFPVRQICFRLADRIGSSARGDVSDNFSIHTSDDEQILSQAEVSSLDEDQSLNSDSYVAPDPRSGRRRGSDDSNKNRYRTNYRFRYGGPTSSESLFDADGRLRAPISSRRDPTNNTAEASQRSMRHGPREGSIRDDRFSAGGAQEKVPPHPVSRTDYDAAHEASTSDSGQHRSKHSHADLRNVATRGSPIGTSNRSVNSISSWIRKPDVWVTPIQHQPMDSPPDSSVQIPERPTRDRNSHSLSARTRRYGIENIEEDEKINKTYDRFASSVTASKRLQRSAIRSTSGDTDINGQFAKTGSSQHTMRSKIFNDTSKQGSQASLSSSSLQGSSLRTPNDESCPSNVQRRDPCASPPQLPQMRQPPKRKWRIKRVWDDEELDGQEQEYIAEDPEDLYDNLRRLFGVVSEDERDVDAVDEQQLSVASGSSASTSSAKPWKVLKLLDIDGELIDHLNGKEESMNEKDLISHLNKMAADDLLYVDVAGEREQDDVAGSEPASHNSLQDISKFESKQDNLSSYSSLDSTINRQQHSSRSMLSLDIGGADGSYSDLCIDGGRVEKPRSWRVRQTAAAFEQNNNVDRTNMSSEDAAQERKGLLPWQNASAGSFPSPSVSERSASKQKVTERRPKSVRPIDSNCVETRVKENDNDVGRLISPMSNKHKERAFNRPECWVSPDERPIIGKRSWKMKREIDADGVDDLAETSVGTKGSGEAGGRERKGRILSEQRPAERDDTVRDGRTVDRPPNAFNKHKQRAFHRPDEWVSPDGKLNSSKRSWKVKRVVGTGDIVDDDSRSNRDGAARRQRSLGRVDNGDGDGSESPSLPELVATSTLGSPSRSGRSGQRLSDYGSPVSGTRERLQDCAVYHGKSPFTRSPQSPPRDFVQVGSGIECSTLAPYLSPLDGSDGRSRKEPACLRDSAASPIMLGASAGHLSTKPASLSERPSKKELPKHRVAIKMWWE